MERKIKTKVVFINRKTKKVQEESFISCCPETKDLDVLRQALLSASNYWKFNLEKLGGHKVQFCTSYIYIVK